MDYRVPRYWLGIKRRLGIGSREWPALAWEPHSEWGKGNLRKDHGVLREPKSVKFKFIEEHRFIFSISCHERQFAWLAGLLQSPYQSQTAVKSGHTGAHQGTDASQPGQLMSPADDLRAERDRLKRWSLQYRAFDASEQHFCCQNAQAQGHDGQ